MIEIIFIFSLPVIYQIFFHKKHVDSMVPPIDLWIAYATCWSLALGLIIGKLF